MEHACHAYLVFFVTATKPRMFYDSPEYQAAREKRIGGADFNMVLAEVA